MNLTEMQDRVYQVTRDSDREFIPVAAVTDWLNEAQSDIANRLGILTKQTTALTTSATGTITLPSDLIEIVSLRVGTDEADVRWEDDTSWLQWQQSQSTPADRLGKVFNSIVELYPVPGTGTSTILRYVYEPTDLSAGADVSALPTENHILMVRYAQAHAKYLEGDENMGDRYLQMYELGLPAHPRGVNRQHPGPIDLVYVPSPAEVDGTHRGG